MRKKKPGLLERLREFDALPDDKKIETRLAWLEKKLLGVLYLLINATAMLVAGLVSWFVSETVGITSFWLLAPLSLLIWVGVAWWSHHRIFRDMPPHLDFVDPAL